jgi:hypothetical protein
MMGVHEHRALFGRADDLLDILAKDEDEHWKLANEVHTSLLEDESCLMLEWWRGRRKLSFYVSYNGYEYLKSWGPRISEDMEDGKIEGPDHVKALWAWLEGG